MHMARQESLPLSKGRKYSAGMLCQTLRRHHCMPALHLMWVPAPACPAALLPLTPSPQGPKPAPQQALTERQVEDARAANAAAEAAAVAVAAPGSASGSGSAALPEAVPVAPRV